MRKNFWLLTIGGKMMKREISLQELRQAYSEIREIKKDHPELSKKIEDFLNRRCWCGYRNLAKMFKGTETPESIFYGVDLKRIERKQLSEEDKRIIKEIVSQAAYK